MADQTQTLFCTYLSAVLLVLNATLSWSWADPIAGLAIAAGALREGIEAWRGGRVLGPRNGASERRRRLRLLLGLQRLLHRTTSW
ncbi:MAG: hypothetical protein ACR2FG_11195 [Marmoricola sp.]